MNISKFLILIFFLSLYQLDNDNTNGNQSEQQKTTNVDDKDTTVKKDDTNNQTQQQQDTTSNESGQNTLSDNNTQNDQNKQKNGEDNVPKFVDTQTNDNKNTPRLTQKKDENETTLIQDKAYKREYNRDYNKNEIMITQFNAPLEFEKLYFIEKSGTIILDEKATSKLLLIRVLNFNKMRYVKIVMVKEQEIFSKTFSDIFDNLMIPISIDLLKKFQDGYIELITEKHFHNVFFIQQIDEIDLDINNGIKLNTDLCDQIVFNLKYDNMDKNNEKRYQFILNSDLGLMNLKGDENLDFFVNFGSENPTTEKYDFKSTGNTGQGLIKTLNKNSKYYCTEDKCQYKILVLSENVNEIMFFASQFLNDTIIKFESNMHILEELEGNEQVTYEIHVPKMNEDWVFGKDPSKGDIKFYVNPNTKPDNLEDYKYKGIEKGSEQMIITGNELKNNNGELQKFFITYISDNSKNSAVFVFYIYNINKYHFHTITLNTFQTGVINPDEIINYKLQLIPDKDSTFSIDLQLISYYGNSDLYVKSCMNSQGCKINLQDIKNIKQQTQYNKNYLQRFSESDIALQDGTFMDQILLQFNCPAQTDQYRSYGFNSFANHNTINKNFDNQYFTSSNCVFTIAVHNRDQKVNQQSMFKLIAKGQGAETYLKIGQAQSVKIDSGQSVLLNTLIDKNQYQFEKYIQIRAVSLIGSCKIYASTITDKPSKNDNESTIEFERKNINSIHTMQKKSNIELNYKDKNYIDLSLQVMSEEYCVVELTININETENDNKTEHIDMDQLYHRQLTRNQIYRKNSQSVYFYNFYYEFQKRPQHRQTLQITLNSTERNLVICVQKDKTTIDFQGECDYFSESNVLELKNLQQEFKQGSQIAISVYLVQEKDDFEILPLEFQLTLTSFTISNDTKIMQLFIPGIVFTHKINPNDTSVFSLNFSPIQFEGFISMTTSHIGLTASIYTDIKDIKQQNKSIAILDHSKFAFIINTPDQIQWSFAQKHLYIVVKNQSKNQGRFSLVYTYDQQPIKLVQDADIFLPSDQDMYFLFEEKGKKQNVNINFGSEGYKFETFGKVVDEKSLNNQPASSLISSAINDYKSDLSSHAELFILQDDFRKFENPFLCIQYVTKIADSDITINNTVTNVSNKLVVSVSVGAKQIYPFEYVKDKGQKDEFRYYYFIIDEPSTILINLVIDSGESDLYISRGQNNFPTQQKFWKRSATTKGDEIVIKPDDFKKEEDMIGVYTIGVFSREYSKYELVYAPDFDSVYQVKFQQILNLNLKPNTDYFLHFHNKYNNFHTIFYAEEDVKVNALDYKEEDKFDFMSYILNDKNYTQNFDFYKGAPPRMRFIEDAYQDQEFFVIKLNSKQENQVVFTIYDNNEPLQIHGEKRFYFSLAKEEEQIFEVDFDNMYEIVLVDVNLKFGKIKFSISTSYDQYDDWQEVNSTKQIYKEKVIDKKDNKDDDIIVFNTIYIKVVASELSYFSILAKPKNKYKQLKKFETEIVYTSSEMDQYFFFQITKNDLKTFTSLQFNLAMIQTYLDDPELYFVANDDFTFNENMPFLPMPVKDVATKDFDELRNTVITPYIKEGFYVLKFLQNDDKIPIKISVTVNNQKNLELNGVRKELLPLNDVKQYFSLYLPQPGILRIIIQSCSPLQVINFRQIDDKNIEQKFDLNKLYFERLQYMQINDNGQGSQQRLKSMTRFLYYANVDKSGLILFEVRKGPQINTNRKYIKSKEIYYEVVTEYQPKNQELVFKDYVKITDDYINNNQVLYKYKFVNKNLVFNFAQLQMKSQLKVDFPNIKKLKMVLVLVVTGYDKSDNGLRERFKTCGMSALETIEKKYVQQITITKQYEKIAQSGLIQVIINKKDLKQFKHYNYLEIYLYANIYFIENDEDQFGITLDRKYVQVPYFDLIIPNNNQESGYFFESFFGLLFSGFFLFLFFAILRIRRKRDIENDLDNIKFEKRNHDDIELQKVQQDTFQIDDTQKSYEEI